MRISVVNMKARSAHHELTSHLQEIDARSKVLEMERELERARRRLENIHKGRYQTDSEPEQSG